MSDGIKRTYLFTKMVSAKSEQDFKDLTNEIVVELQEIQQLKDTNKQLLEALEAIKESSYSIFPEGIFISEDAYSLVIKAITNAKQVMGGKG